MSSFQFPEVATPPSALLASGHRPSPLARSSSAVGAGRQGQSVSSAPKAGPGTREQEKKKKKKKKKKEEEMVSLRRFARPRAEWSGKLTRPRRLGAEPG